VQGGYEAVFDPFGSFWALLDAFGRQLTVAGTTERTLSQNLANPEPFASFLEDRGEDLAGSDAIL